MASVRITIGKHVGGTVLIAYPPLLTHTHLGIINLVSENKKFVQNQYLFLLNCYSGIEALSLDSPLDVGPFFDIGFGDDVLLSCSL